MVESGENTFDSYKKLTIKDAILMLKFPCEAFKNTIVNCFKHGWYMESDETI